MQLEQGWITDNGSQTVLIVHQDCRTDVALALISNLSPVMHALYLGQM